MRVGRDSGVGNKQAVKFLSNRAIGLIVRPGMTRSQLTEVKETDLQEAVLHLIHEIVRKVNGWA